MSALPFPPSEFAGRAVRLQAAMQEADLAALFLTAPADIFYLTGFLTRFWESPTRPWFVLLPADGAPVAVIPTIGGALMRRTWVTDIRSWEAPDPVNDGIGLLAATLAELTPARARIGLPMGAEAHLRMPLGDFFRLREAVAPRDFVDATPALRAVREVKSEAEIAAIRAICRVADAAFARVPEIAGPGRPLDAVFRAFQGLCLAEGADWVAYLAGGAGPGGYRDVISPAGPEPLAAGDVLMLDTGAVRDGYFCDFNRNFAIGRASDATRRAHAALIAATDAGIAAARPGATAADLHRAVTDAVRAAGATPAGGRVGHGLGLTLTEWPSLIPADRTQLRPGMVLTVEPAVVTGPGRIMVHEENIVLREGGAEPLSTLAPAEIPVLGRGA